MANFPSRSCGPLILALLHLLIHSSTEVWGYPAGAPVSTCLTMFPRHGKAEMQVGPSPFLVTVSPATYTPGQIISVQIAATDNQRRFKGIQVKATRVKDDKESTVGTFVKIPANVTKAFSCEGSYKGMVTHTQQLARVHRTGPIQLEWKAPEINVGDIVFVATVVERYDVFWTRLTAKLATHDPEFSHRPETVVSDLPYQQMVNYSIDLTTCGEDKGCFLYPRYCSSEDCMAAATFRKENENFHFELMARNSTYVSLGFSEDIIMGDDETITCTADNSGLFSVQHGYNPSRHNIRIVSHQLSPITVRTVNSNIMCTFSRPLVTVTRTVNQSATVLQYINRTWDLSSDYYLMLAFGSVKTGSDVMNKHVVLPPVTDAKVSFRKYDIHSGSAIPSAVKLHGSLMAMAWVVVVGVSTAMSRYHKHWMAGKRLCGTAVWFQIHRTVGIVAVVFTFSGLTVIVVYIGGFINVVKKPEAAKHAILGLIVVILLTVQLLFGMFRPAPTSEWRPYFKWGHSILGQLSHILSAVTMFLALSVPFFPAEMHNFGIAVLTSWVTVQIAWTIVLELRRCCTIDLDPRRLMKMTVREVLRSADTVLLFFYFLTLLLLGVATLSAILIF